MCFVLGLFYYHQKFLKKEEKIETQKIKETTITIMRQVRKEKDFKHTCVNSLPYLSPSFPFPSLSLFPFSSLSFTSLPLSSSFLPSLHLPFPSPHLIPYLPFPSAPFFFSFLLLPFASPPLFSPFFSFTPSLTPSTLSFLFLLPYIFYITCKSMYITMQITV